MHNRGLDLDGIVNSPTLRDQLRSATAPLHRRLDEEMGRLDLSDRADYTSFLLVQLAARLPIERWLADHAPAPVSPPATAALLLDDLAALEHPVSLTPVPFAISDEADPIGAAWALAGSHLGNRAMLVGLRKRPAPNNLPTAFLSDPAMAGYWKRLRPLIETPVEPRRAERAVAAAKAVFAQFLATGAKLGQRLAA